MSSEDFYSRTRLLIGDGVEKLKNSHVAVFGVGGVGSYTVEALARCGVGKLTLIDADTVSESNINRQLIALNSTVGKDKVSVAKERIMDINPKADVIPYKLFVNEENISTFDFSSFDYVVDAIDTVFSKILIIEAAKRSSAPIISCMGAGNKLDPTLFKIADISKTSVCPLARKMRYELKKRGIGKVKVLFSTEAPITADDNQSRVPASISFVPSVAGLMIAGEVIKDLIKNNGI